MLRVLFASAARVLHAACSCTPPVAFRTDADCASEAGMEFEDGAVEEPTEPGTNAGMLASCILSGEVFSQAGLRAAFKISGNTTSSTAETPDDGPWDCTDRCLQGVVSPTDGNSATNITYTPWVKVLQLPAGKSWTTE